MRCRKEACTAYETVKERGYARVCQDCPFVPLFRALGKLDVPVAGDAGCSIRATREPYEAVDVVYGLGSSVGVASGFRKKGIAVIGDYALAHSGLQALINAVWQKRDLLVIVLKNDVAAMTGGQEAPDLTALLEALLPVRYLRPQATDVELERVLHEELGKAGTRAVVATGRCRRLPRLRLFVVFVRIAAEFRVQRTRTHARALVHMRGPAPVAHAQPT